MDRASQHENRIRPAKVAPGVPARPAHNHFKAAAPKRLGDNRVRTSPIEHQALADGIFPAWIGKDTAHATQVAFAFFPDVTDKQKGESVTDSYRAQEGGNGEHRRHSCAVVGNARAIDTIALLSYVQRCTSWENSIDMRAE